MNRRLYVCIVLLVVIVCSSGSIKKSLTPQTPSIKYSESIKHYDDIYRLLKDSIIGGKAPYKLSMYDFLSNTTDHILYFEVEKLPLDRGGETRCSEMGVKTLHDTIILNSEFLKRGCKEYLVQIIAHESIHALINWSVHSFARHKNEVDTNFLQGCFSANWKIITDDLHNISEIEKHSLMWNYLDSIRRCIYEYANPNLHYSLRHTIALSLAWGGLEGTPEWQNRLDTCLSKWVDAAAINFNRPAEQEEYPYPSCYNRRQHKQLLQQTKDVFQKTKSAIYNNTNY